MYRIREDVDLSPVVGEFTTQVRVGQSDIQFSFGDVDFAVSSPIDLFRDGERIAHWEAGKWPEPGFYEIMNTTVLRCEVVNDRLIVIEFENGVEVHLVDDSDEYETMSITFSGNATPLIV